MLLKDTKLFAQERVLVVVLDIKASRSEWTNEDVKDEMRELVIACGGKFIDGVVFPINKITPKYFITEGKVIDLIDIISIKDIDTVVFSHELKSSQQRNIEEKINVKTIDRTQLILDIFAKNAGSKESKMQVELAQLEYLLPRLVGKGIELSRLGGGIGTLGPGETKLEADRQRLSQKITKLKRGLKEIVENRHLKRKRRKQDGVPLISLVGYTNAGKSTLLNNLTSAKQKTRDGLFTTLDSLSRQLTLLNHQRIIISDTVGFMHELPHRLIESFKATLEEVSDADLLLHVVDVSHPKFRLKIESVQHVLSDLGAQDKPVIYVFNKIDKLADTDWIEDLMQNYDLAVQCSARKNINIDNVLKIIEDQLSALVTELNVDIPIGRMDLVNLAHEQGEVYSIKYYNDYINLRVLIPSKYAPKFQINKKSA